jgi:hypothetical protein
MVATQQEDSTSRKVPQRTVDQRLLALGKANSIRTKRARLKLDLKAGRTSIRDILLEPPEWVETMKVFDALLACPRYGRVKVNHLLAVCRVSPSKTIGGISPRQRREIISMLRR